MSLPAPQVTFPLGRGQEGDVVGFYTLSMAGVASEGLARRRGVKKLPRCPDHVIVLDDSAPQRSREVMAELATRR